MNMDPKMVANRFYEIVSHWSASDLDEICSPDLRGHAGAGADLAELKASIGGFLAAFPDLRAEIKYLVCEGDLVSAWLSYTATHQQEFAGIPGSGRPVMFAAWDLLRIENGKIVEITQYCDLFSILNQIGALPTASPAAGGMPPVLAQ
jgi:ketosteroid isomerase-like protein